MMQVAMVREVGRRQSSKTNPRAKTSKSKEAYFDDEHYVNEFGINRFLSMIKAGL